LAESYIRDYLDEAGEIINTLDVPSIQKIIDLIVEIRRQEGRLFFLGVGGGAANASHAVNDFRKIAGLESYTPVDNVSELTAQINDHGWEKSLVNWLMTSRLGSRDGVFVFSVGGGDKDRNISANIVSALDYARGAGAKIMGIVGRDGGYTAKVADAVVIVPPVNPETVTPLAESFQSLIWHLVVSHPKVKLNPMKWESAK
jgi:D-sedoheptulose 7-phosphate isomerase